MGSDGKGREQGSDDGPDTRQAGERAAVVARIPTPMTVTPLPTRVPVTMGQRAVELMRNPAVMLSAGAALTLVAEVGLRLLEQPASGSALLRRARTATDRSRRSLVINETVTITRRIEISTPK